MARKTIIVSELSGERAENPARLTIVYRDGSRVELDVDAGEVREMARKGEKRPRRGRRPKALR